MHHLMWCQAACSLLHPSPAPTGCGLQTRAGTGRERSVQQVHRLSSSQSMHGLPCDGWAQGGCQQTWVGKLRSESITSLKYLVPGHVVLFVVRQFMHCQCNYQRWGVIWHQLQVSAVGHADTMPVCSSRRQGQQLVQAASSAVKVPHHCETVCVRALSTSRWPDQQQTT